MTDHLQFDEAVAGYAIDALDHAERREFEAHLATCEQCQREVAELQRVGAALALAVEPEAPPASLRARVLARATAGAPARSPVVALPRPLPAGPRRAISFGRLATAAGFIAAVSLAAYSWSLRSQIDSLRDMVASMSDRADQLRDQVASLRLDNIRLLNTMNVVDAPDMLRVGLQGDKNLAAGAKGHAYLSRGRGLVVSAEGLPSLQPGRVYQLWMVMPDHDPVSAGLVRVDAKGAAMFATPLPAGLTVPPNTQVTLAFTNEPDGGSPRPSTPIVLSGVTTTPS